MDATVGRESIQAVEEEASLISTVNKPVRFTYIFPRELLAFMSELRRFLRANIISNLP